MFLLENNKRELKQLIDSYTKWAHDRYLGYKPLISVVVSPNMWDFVSQGLWPFPDPIFDFLFLNLSKTIGGKLVGFLSVNDVDMFQSVLKSIF